MWSATRARRWRTALLLLSFLSGAFQLWHLYVVMLVQGVFSTLQTPASQAAIAMLVPENQRDRANGIREIGFPLAGVVAPALAGLLYTVIDVTGVMLIDLATFLVAIVVIFSLHIPRPTQSAEDQETAGVWWRETLAGWRFLWQRRALLGLAVYTSFVWFLINGPLELATPYLITITGSEALLGVLLGALNFRRVCRGRCSRAGRQSAPSCSGHSGGVRAARRDADCLGWWCVSRCSSA